MKRNIALLLSILLLLCTVNFSSPGASAQDNSVSTEDLVYQLLDSGLGNTLTLRNYPGQFDFTYLTKKYPALGQLAQRADAVDVLVNMIAERANKQDMDLFYLSLIIHEPEFYQLLSEEQKEQVATHTQILYAPAAHTQAATEP